jgi:hypothetical protein
VLRFAIVNHKTRFLIQLTGGGKKGKINHENRIPGNNKYSLLPGVMVSVAILTGERSVLQYLADPFLHGIEMAISEQ